MSKERLIAAIDIGSSKIATIIASVTEERLSVIGVSTVPSRGIRKGVVVDIDNAVSAISKSLEAAERMAGCSVSQVLACVGGSHIESLNSHGVVAVSRPGSEIVAEDVTRVTEAAQAVSLPSNREIIHVIPRDFIVDSQDGIHEPVGMSGVRLEVETNIISGSATALHNLAKCVEQVGVSISDFVYSGLASAESILTETEKELGTVLVDIGGGTTSMIIYIEGSPVFSSVLPMGGQNITNDLAIGLGTSLENAEKVKLKLSSALKEDVDINVKELGIEGTEIIPKKYLTSIIRFRLDELFSIVSLEIKKSGFSGKLPAGVVLSGGAARTHEIEQAAKMVLKLPVRVGSPRGVVGLIDEITGPAYSSGIGALLYGQSLDLSRESGNGAKNKVVNIFVKVREWIKSFLP
ncbi:MAG: cell division protein FtsA [candidate division WWE3 bacterium]|nr:cell division protein FtsA [candidate division WWE3 bacterium]